MAFKEEEYLWLSGLQHFSFCRRRNIGFIQLILRINESHPARGGWIEIRTGSATSAPR